MDLQKADEQHYLFQVNVIYVEAGFLGVVTTFGMTITFEFFCNPFAVPSKWHLPSNHCRCANGMSCGSHS